MPNYEYQCNECNDIFTLWNIPVSARNKQICPECQSSKIRIIIYNFMRIKLVGEGFYKNDHGWRPDMDRLLRKYDKKRAKGWQPPSIDEQDQEE